MSENSKRNEHQKKIRVLIEASKLLSNETDGIRRYVHDLLSQIALQINEDRYEWHIDVFIGRGMFFTIADIRSIFNQQSPSCSAVNSSKKIKWMKVFLPAREALKEIVGKHSKNRLAEFREAIRTHVHNILCRFNPILQFRRYDLVHLTLPQSYIHFQACQTRMVTTVHDLTHIRFPEFHLPENIENANQGMQLSIEKQSEFISVSKATRNDLVASHPEIMPDNVHVVYEGADRERFKPGLPRDQVEAILLKYGIPARPFFLSLSTIEPRKNLTNAIRAFMLLIKEKPEIKHNFVIAGKLGWADQAVLNMAESRPDRLILTGFVDDEDLAGLYTGAAALVYVSYCEGFGLPPLEAMCCGTPVVFGNNSSMIEVVGEGGLAADPYSVVDIKDKCADLALDECLRNSLSEKALDRSRLFSWKTAAESTLGIYRAVAAKC